MTDPRNDDDQIERLEDEAEALEERAERDGLIPDPDDADDDGVGPQTGVVP